MQEAWLKQRKGGRRAVVVRGTSPGVYIAAFQFGCVTWSKCLTALCLSLLICKHEDYNSIYHIGYCRIN